MRVRLKIWGKAAFYALKKAANFAALIFIRKKGFLFLL